LNRYIFILSARLQVRPQRLPPLYHPVRLYRYFKHFNAGILIQSYGSLCGMFSVQSGAGAVPIWAFLLSCAAYLSPIWIFISCVAGRGQRDLWTKRKHSLR